MIERRLAQRLLTLRQDRQITLTTLARLTGISAAHLSRIEKFERKPSIGALLQIARAYEMSLSQLVEEGDSRPYHLVAADAGPVHRNADASYRILSGPGAATNIVEATFPPGRTTSAVSHEGQEWMQIVSGGIELTLGTEVVHLRKGDAIQFDAALPHHIRATSKAAATILLISSGNVPLTH